MLHERDKPFVYTGCDGKGGRIRYKVFLRREIKIKASGKMLGLREN